MAISTFVIWKITISAQSAQIFYLTGLPGGRTRLDGWTTYQNRMWPGSYWRLWTDAILHQIHLRVFRQVKALAEADAALRVSNGGLR